MRFWQLLRLGRPLACLFSSAAWIFLPCPHCKILPGQRLRKSKKKRRPERSLREEEWESAETCAGMADVKAWFVRVKIVPVPKQLQVAPPIAIKRNDSFPSAVIFSRIDSRSVRRCIAHANHIPVIDEDKVFWVLSRDLIMIKLVSRFSEAELDFLRE